MLYSNIKERVRNTLIWSQKYTNTDMVYLAKNSFWLLLTSLGSFLLLFASNIIFANFLSKEQLGLYKYILTLFNLLSAFSLTGMNTAVTRATAQGEEGAFKKSYYYQLKWNLIITAISSIFSLYYLKLNQPILALSLILIGLCSPIINSANTYVAYLQGKKDYKKLFTYNSILNIFSTLLIITSVIISKRAIYIATTYLLASVALNIFLYYRTIKIYKPNNIYREETLAYGKHLSIMNFLTIAANNLDKFLTFNLLGASPLAVYNFAIAAPEQLRGLYKIIPALSIPKISEKKVFIFDRTFRKKILQLITLSAITVIVYWIFCPLLFHWFFPAYNNSILFSRIFSLSIIFSAPTMFIISTLQSRGATKLLYKYNLHTSWVQIIFIGIFIYFFGLLGLVIARVIASLFNIIYSLLLAKAYNFSNTTK